MSAPDVLVTVEGGVAQVDVWRPGIVVELRDYDVDGEDDDDLWTDAHGRAEYYLMSPQSVLSVTKGRNSETPNALCRG